MVYPSNSSGATGFSVLFAPLAHLDRAPGYELGGEWFKSTRVCDKTWDSSSIGRAADS